MDFGSFHSILQFYMVGGGVLHHFISPAPHLPAMVRWWGGGTDPRLMDAPLPDPPLESETGEYLLPGSPLGS